MTKVAIVEDNPTLRKYLAEMIGNTPGHRCVCTCASAEEAFVEIPAHKPLFRPIRQIERKDRVIDPARDVIEVTVVRCEGHVRDQIAPAVRACRQRRAVGRIQVENEDLILVVR